MVYRDSIYHCRRPSADHLRRWKGVFSHGTQWSSVGCFPGSGRALPPSWNHYPIDSRRASREAHPHLLAPQEGTRASGVGRRSSIRVEPRLGGDSGSIEVHQNAPRRSPEAPEAQTATPAAATPAISERLSVTRGLRSRNPSQRKRSHTATLDPRVAVTQADSVSVQLCLWTCRRHGGRGGREYCRLVADRTGPQQWRCVHLHHEPPRRAGQSAWHRNPPGNCGRR